MKIGQPTPSLKSRVEKTFGSRFNRCSAHKNRHRYATNNYISGQAASGNQLTPEVFAEKKNQDDRSESVLLSLTSAISPSKQSALVPTVSQSKVLQWNSQARSSTTGRIRLIKCTQHWSVKITNTCRLERLHPRRTKGEAKPNRETSGPPRHLSAPEPRS